MHIGSLPCVEAKIKEQESEIDQDLSSSAVALALCKCDPVLNDGYNTRGLSKNAVVEGESKRFIEKFVKQHEDEEDYSSD
ncbi:hypothetical protein M5K25_024584 [Dendrobium thyrsiflorum]|uniref:Uncharacterized protein n=1 Tax=Dendrobium thyrsiflorum TaxID=117978 RepID=A0ABD0U2S4_DENTH